MPGTYRKRIYMSLVHTDSFRQTPICAHSTQRVNAETFTLCQELRAEYTRREKGKFSHCTLDFIDSLEFLGMS